MSTLSIIARTLFPEVQQRPSSRQPLRNGQGSTLSQLLSVCYALVPLVAVLNIYLAS